MKRQRMPCTSASEGNIDEGWTRFVLEQLVSVLLHSDRNQGGNSSTSTMAGDSQRQHRDDAGEAPAGPLRARRPGRRR
jgi:hypothetical protein